MDRVEEIETAITSLSSEEYQRLVDWLRTREQTRWDQQADRDSFAGKLDFLFKEADSELAVPRSIGESGFAGMWAHRDDITDGVSYVNRLRDKPRG